MVRGNFTGVMTLGSYGAILLLTKASELTALRLSRFSSIVDTTGYILS